MVGKKHQCKTSWMCGVIKTKGRENSSRESVGCEIVGTGI
jgi:N-acetyl-anhydromuramyl-L-alanine amidase AmpD